jgi:hypothetical protein
MPGGGLSMEDMVCSKHTWVSKLCHLLSLVLEMMCSKDLGLCASLCPTSSSFSFILQSFSHLWPYSLPPSSFPSVGFELRASWLLGRYSSSWAMPPALFCFIFEVGRILDFCLWLASDWDPPTCGLLCSWDHRCPPLYLLVSWDGISLFALAGLNPWSFQSLSLSSWDYCLVSLCPAHHLPFFRIRNWDQSRWWGRTGGDKECVVSSLGV